MPSLGTEKTGQAYWRSLDELLQTPEFRAQIEREFPSIADDLLSSGSRRTFLKVMGASLAFAGLTGCRWPRENIVPQTVQPNGRTPGVPEHYATSMELGGVGAGLVVTSFDGRPIKIEGNAMHPGSLGATSAFAQAAILEMYDPDRSRMQMQKSGDGAGREPRGPRSWDEFAAFAGPHFTSIRNAAGDGLSILSETSSSPTLAALKEQFLKALPKAKTTICSITILISCD
jgi:molybdopterin-containing oxidoreductase family iron-sulfur binding subunit